jgi:hypothetical protein
VFLFQVNLLKGIDICVLFIPFLVFGHFWQQSYENTKILRNLCLHFTRQDGKKWKENQATKVTKIPKTKRRKYGMNQTLDLCYVPGMKALFHQILIRREFHKNLQYKNLVQL